jgi:hypothetical protein
LKYSQGRITGRADAGDQLIEKGNAFACGEEELGRRLFGQLYDNARKAPRIDSSAEAADPVL